VSIVTPAPEDLVPGELKYRLASGDVVRVDVFELVTPGEVEREELTVDQTGNIRLKEVGDIAAAGLTLEEFQREIEAKVSRLIANPVVQVSLSRGQSFQFSIAGAVNQTGVYTLERPDFRLTEAIALSGGTLPTTQRVKVIRAAPLDDTLRPVYPTPEAGHAPKAGDTAKPAQPGTNLDDLINQLDATKKPADAPKSEAPKSEAPKSDAPAGDAPKADAPKGGESIGDALAAPGAVNGYRRVLAQDDKPTVDIDDLNEKKPADGAAKAGAAAATTPAGAGMGGYTFNEALGRWERGGAARGTAEHGGRPAPQASPSMYATRIIEIDYQKLIKGDPNLNVVIRPSDQIYVEPPETGFLYIDGEINRIGVYNLENTNGRLTLSRFVSAAGGLAPTAIPNRVDLVRMLGDDREATIRIDLAAIRNRSEPDVYMQANDHVIIGTNFIATPLAVIRNGFRMTYGFGFLLDRNFGNDVFGPPPDNNPFN
jgi:protein involved in polysaccharide export with SLBB domain